MNINYIRDSLNESVNSFKEYGTDTVPLMEVVEEIIHFISSGNEVPQAFEFYGANWAAPGILLTFSGHDIEQKLREHYDEPLTFDEVSFDSFLEGFKYYIQVHVLTL